MGGLFSFPFDKGFKPIMEMYGLKNSDLTEDTFAQVIIGKINLQTQDTNEKKIEYLKSFLKAIYAKIGQSPPLDKTSNGRRLDTTKPSKHEDIKDWINKKKEDYKKEIFAAIEELQNQPLSGGSRKKYKKIYIMGGSFPFDKEFKPIIDIYGLKNSDLTEDTFAQVIIGKINLQTKDTNEKKIEYLKLFLKAIYAKIGQSPPLDKNNNGRRLDTIKPSKHEDIKDWINKKKDDYKKEIFDAIAALEPATVAGGSRKKSKKSRRS
jgi:hypothetical protein